MSISLYKPTKKITGAAISFQASDRDKNLYVSIIKQFSWDEATKKGSFSENRGVEGKETTVKFNQIEAGGMLDALERFYNFEAYHSSKSYVTQIFFSLAEGENPNCFVFKLNQTSTSDATKKSSFFIPISFAEARLIREYLIHYLHKSFKKIELQRQSKQESQPAPQAAPEPQPEQNSDAQALADFQETSAQTTEGGDGNSSVNW